MKRLLPILALSLAICGTAVAADWPMFIGDGDRTPPKQGLNLVDHLDHATVLWTLQHHMTVGKGLYPRTVRESRERGIEPFYGGASSPIAADGLVFAAYHKPNGKVKAKRTPWRTMGEDNLALLPDWFFSVTADDCLLAVDAVTGAVKWEAVEENKGLNRLGHKRGHWCVSPAFADGRVFSLGTAGLLYAYDAKTGKKLWETLARPDFKNQLEEYLESKALPFTQGNEKGSLVVAGGNVIVPTSGLAAFDVKTGKPAWSIDRIRSKHATPAFWRHEGKVYLVVGNGTGQIRLIDPADGTVLWTHEGLGNQLGAINVTGDIAILNVGSRTSDDEKANGLFGAFRLTKKGPEHLWTLPDKPAYRHSWTMDRGAERRAAIQDGHVYLVVGLNREDKLVTTEAETGKIVDEFDVPGWHAPYPVEDRLMIMDDRAHTDPVTLAWYSIENPATPKELHGSKALPFRTTTAYEVPMEMPVVDGVLYLRTLEGLAALDLRKPKQAAANRPIRARVPGDLLGRDGPVDLTFVQRDGKLRHGGFHGSRALHAVETAEASWDGEHLRGTLGIDPSGVRQYGLYTVNAELAKDGWLEGTLASCVPAFAEPIEVHGKVTAMRRQPAWMPPCDDVLRLEEAVFQTGGNVGRLLLFVRHEDGTLQDVAGFADQTTKTPPVIEPGDLAVENGRLRGTFQARFRPDEWTTPLTEKGSSAAATYTIDAALGKRDGTEAGRYDGVYGTAWTETADLLPPG